MNNVRGFDIANHFCEYAGVTTHFNFTDNFPSKDVQIPFIAQYLNELNGTDPTDHEIEELYSEVNRCVMVPFFFFFYYCNIFNILL